MLALVPYRILASKTPSQQFCIAPKCSKYREQQERFEIRILHLISHIYTHQFL
jgi:hypothetical protein